MSRPPRRSGDEILSRSFVTSVLVYGGLITAATLAAFLWGLERSPAHASTMAFMTLAFAQTLHLGNARSARAVLRPSAITANPYAIAGAAMAIGLQLVAMYAPALSALLHLTRFTGADWLVVVGAAAVPALAGQAWRALSVRP
jgi:Ca2+-transporting ATPase